MARVPSLLVAPGQVCQDTVIGLPIGTSISCLMIHGSSFTRTFRYLGSLIFYNLHDNNNITARIAAANASMGALKDLWRNPHLDMYSKYLVFKAISMNLLLWGVETWSLQKLQLDTFEVFLHRSI